MKIEIEFTLKETGAHGADEVLEWVEVICTFANQFWWTYANMQQDGDIR